MVFDEETGYLLLLLRMLMMLTMLMLLWVEGWARRLRDELAPVPGEEVPEPEPGFSASAPGTG